MKIFMSGATGYIGHPLAFRLANEGNTIHALCRTPSKEKLIQHENIKVFKGDITDYNLVLTAMKGCTQVYHLAGYVSVYAKDNSIFYDINVGGTKNILDSANALGIDRVCFTSTAGVLGPSKGKPVEESDKRIGTAFSPYEDSKTKAEDLCREYVKQKGMEIVMVNPPRIYGEGIESESNAVTKLMKWYIEGKWKLLPGNGKRTGSYVHIDDVVNGHVLAMERGRPGERYILSGENLSYNEFFGLISELSGKKNFLIPVPVPLMIATGYVMTGLAKITGKPPLLTSAWAEKFSYDWSLSCEKAKKELGYSFISAREGFKKTIDAILNNQREENVHKTRSLNSN